MSDFSTAILFGLGLSVASNPALALNAATMNEYCQLEDMPQALRQTLIVIDGRVMVPETSEVNADDANLPWRRFAVSYLDGSQSDINTRLDPRERVTVVTANADGSGTTVLFSGCVPTFSVEEAGMMRAEDSSIGKFFGSSWQSRHEDMAKDFSRAAQRGLREVTHQLPPARPAGEPFADGSLVNSLRRSVTLDPAYGIPRVVLYTDLSQYDFPEGSASEMRMAGFADASNALLDLGRSELQLLSVRDPESKQAHSYLPAFFLGSNADLSYQGPAAGAVPGSHQVVETDVFSGAVNYGDAGSYPVMMRLVRDINGSVSNAWIEETRVTQRTVPFTGQLSCSDGECSFTQSREFARIWAADPTSDTPSCGEKMPFLGLQMLQFTTDGKTLKGTISDSLCFPEGMDDGLTFELQRAQNGRW